MKHYKICAYAISKNEEQFVDRWMDAVGEADAIIVTDTGSTDNTVKRLRERGAIVYEESISPWRFDTARNLAMDHVPADADICVSNDLDEVFEPGWRKKLESAWRPEHTRAEYAFVWSHSPDGTPNKQFPMEKIHRRHDFRWIHPVHEVLAYSGADEDRTVVVDGLTLHHYPDASKPRSQYLPLLELSAQENPQNDRIAFWLGREYMYYGMYDQCIATLERHLGLQTARWDEERSASMRFLAHCYQEKEDWQQAKSWLYRAVAECPRVREPYLALAQLGDQQADWLMVYAMVQKGLSITKSSGSYLVQPECWGAALYDYGAIGAYWMGLYDEAKAYALRACEMEPDDERLQSNLALIMRKTDTAKGAESCVV